jgi:hypothetical protein
VSAIYLRSFDALGLEAALKPGDGFAPRGPAALV